MANNTTNDRYWLIDTAAELIGVGKDIRIAKLVLQPAAQNDAVTIQEYVGNALVQAAYLIDLRSAFSMLELDFGPKGRNFSGFKVSAITSGAKLHVYLA